MPPASAAQGISSNADTGLGLSLPLGTGYERRKNQLKQELQLDYKQYVATKKDLQAREPRPQPQGLSLPIDDKISVQEKLREERNKEYNLFLQKQAQNRSLRRGVAAVTTKPGHVQALDAVSIPSPASPLLIPNMHTNYHPPPRERPTSRRDAATLTEAVDNGNRTGTWVSGHRGRRRWQLIRPKEPYSSEEEFNTDKEEELEVRLRRRQDRHTPDYKEERRTREHRANSLQMPDRMRTAARSRPATSRDEAEFATGLMIGRAEEQTASQLRKEQYKQELLQQIAERQRNKIREKTLGLRVAVTGATDPEKEPDRITHFSGVNQRYNNRKQDISSKHGIDLEPRGKHPNPRPGDDKPTEHRERKASSGNSQVDFSQLTGTTVSGSGTRAAQGVPSLDYFNEDYHRDFSNTLGEVAVPRVAAVPPPVPPAVMDHYKTPHDAAYYYYGTRNPLDPNLQHYQNGAPDREHQSGSFHSPLQRAPPLRRRDRTEVTDHRASPLIIGEAPPDKSKQRRESTQSYQEALRQQIKDREERKRREKEEKERYDAKIEAELMAYNPWGRSGGGAPIKDQNGNLVSNLTQMHRINEESYRNHVPRDSGHTQSYLVRNGHTPRGEARAPLSHQLSGFTEEGYKGELKKQIEEKKRKQEEERERMRLEEEKEEKRLEDQRACIQREYEEEQRKQKKQRQENQNWIHEHKTQTQREKRTRREEEMRMKEPDSARGREEKMTLFYEREPSPPIPTLRKKQTNLVTSRPPSVVSQLSSRTERSVSAPSYRNVPANVQDNQQEVFRELSALRRYLRKEQRQLEVQLGQTDRQDGRYSPPSRPRGRPRVNAFESPHTQAAQPSIRSPSSGAARVHMQNIREFNQLKYRDTASRKEVRHMYPDPPTDAQSLDIQQQALLREQQRENRLMKREEERDFLDQDLNHYRPEVALSTDQPDAQSLHSVTSLNLDSKVRPHNQRHITRQDTRTGDHKSRSEGPHGDEADALSLRSALERRVSVDTVATEPWLRPGTSDAVKGRGGCRERPNSRIDAPPWLTHRVT
uniref:centrosome and spindle pole associated protein 1 n=1 Tax=Semicossyphus pulcher TaxID=241346 RepID=UPI0037E9B43B